MATQVITVAGYLLIWCAFFDLLLLSLHKLNVHRPIQVGPLDVSSYIKPGWNAARIIQLADTSQYMFILHASIPSQEELLQLRNKKEFAGYLQRKHSNAVTS